MKKKKEGTQNAPKLWFRYILIGLDSDSCETGTFSVTEAGVAGGADVSVGVVAVLELVAAVSDVLAYKLFICWSNIQIFKQQLNDNSKLSMSKKYNGSIKLA